MFGPLPPATGLTGQIVDVQPINACSPISNVSSAGFAITGKIALVYADPNCVLGSKALFAQQMGAIAGVMYMCTPGAPCTCFRILIKP